MKRDVHLEYEYPYPPDAVWRAITDPELMASWLMKNDFQLRVGHKFRFTAPPQPGWDGIVLCEVLEVEAPRRLVYSWKGTANKFTTRVTWTLVPTASGTRLVLDHDGFEGVGGILLSFMLGSGWKRMMRQRLRETIAGEALSPRACHPEGSAT
jgi:uncharacterized protein YndB with AHSA1/START domain